MKTVFNSVKWIALVVVAVVLGLYVSGNQFLLKGVWAAYLHGNTSATIGDAQFFDTRTVEVGTPTPWKVSDFYYEWDITGDLRKSLEETQTVAFLMISGG